MKKSSTVFLQIVIVLIGIGALALMLWEPQVEGVNAHKTFSQVYFHDPFLAYAYAASIAFYMGLYQAFKLLGYIGQNKVFSLDSVKALRTIKYCALILAGAIVAAEAFIMIHARMHPEVGAKDGPEGAVMLGIVATFATFVVATAAAVFQRILQNAVEMKSENDLTV